MVQVFQGSTIEAEVTIVSEQYKLNEATTDFTAEFYIRGKRSKGSVSVKKSEGWFNTGDDNTFHAHVPTESLGIGRLCCTVSGTYADPIHKDASGKAYSLPFVEGINSEIAIVDKYL